MLERLSRAEPKILQVWLVGAGVAGFGLGGMLGPRIQRYARWITLAGLLLHSWSMYKIYVQQE